MSKHTQVACTKIYPELHRFTDTKIKRSSFCLNIGICGAKCQKATHTCTKRFQISH